MPVPGFSPERLALLDCASVTTTEYVLLLPPPEAVATMVMVLGPTTRGIAFDAVPELTATPFTVMVPFGSTAVGVIVIEATPFATLAA